MKNSNKIKIFDLWFKRITKGWTKEQKRECYNSYFNIFLLGYECAVKEYDKKLQKYLDKKGI